MKNWSAVYALAFTVSALIIAEFIPAGVLSPMAIDLRVSEGMAGQTVSATSVFAVLASLLVAYVTRAHDRRIVLLALTAVLVISNVVSAFASNFAVLLVGRALLGIALGGLWSMAAAITMRLVEGQLVPRALAVLFGGSSSAAAFAAPMGSALSERIGWRNVFLISGALGLIAFFWEFVSLPRLKPLAPVRLGTVLEVSRGPGFALGMGAVIFVFGGRFASFTYFRPFLEGTTGLGVDALSALLLLFGLSNFVGTSVAGALIARNMGLTLTLVPLALGAVSLAFLPLGHSVVAVTVLTFLWGSVFGPVPVGWSTWVTRMAPAHAETAGGIFVASIQLSAALGALVGGVAFDARGSGAVFVVCAIFWALSSLIARVIFTRSARLPT